MREEGGDSTFNIVGRVLLAIALENWHFDVRRDYAC